MTITMFIVYSDASGGRSLGVTIVSGWISEKVQWGLFDIDWRLLLAKYDVPYFHMREFAHSVGPFATWKGQEGQRANFLRLAVETIANRVHQGFACVVDHAIYEEIDAQYELSEAVGNPYAHAARDIMAHANRWLRKSQRGIPVEYVFEDGDEGKGLLLDAVTRYNKIVDGNDVLSVPTFGVPHDRGTTRGLTPLQAADFAAYELMKAYRMGEDEPLWKYRKSIQALSRIPAWWGQYTKKDFIQLCQAAGIAKRNNGK
jgi:hypothetical protein